MPAAAALAVEPLSHGSPVYVDGTLGAAVVGPDHLKIDSKQVGDGNAGGGLLGLQLAKLPVSDGWPQYLEVGDQDIARHTSREG